MLVVPDSNIMYPDLFFESDAITTILNAEEVEGIKFMIPEVVIDELRNHVEERADEAIGDVNKSHSQIDSLVGHNRYTDGCIASHQKQDILDRFEERVNQFLEEGRILAYPSISPKELADRSIQDRRPFQSSGKGNQKSDRGMRDTLIWLTLKEHLKRTDDTVPQILFATQDTVFVAEENRLHESLVYELKNEGFSQESVTIRRNLNDVIIEFISPLRT